MNCGLDVWSTDYRRKTRRSQKMFERSSKLHVNGISHNIRYFEPYPFVTRSASAQHLFDVDNNRYTDYWMGHWSLILGHRPDVVQAALKKQIELGWMYGTLNEQTLGLSAMIAEAVPVAERIRYVTSGTEAVMYAARLARGTTGRNIIVKVDGGWHGYTSDLLKSVNWPFDVPESTGVINDDAIVSIPYNDVSGAISILDEYKDDLAGVLVEPILAGGGCILAEPDYMRAIQETVHGHGGLLILDEIVTGFRLGYGCMYSQMDLDPDIVTLGKVVGGGMPIGVICGKVDVMERANTSRMDRKSRCYVGGGTFSANPASMTAGHATLQVLKENQDIYDKINRMGDNARSDATRILDEMCSVTGAGSLFMTHFSGGGQKPISDAIAASQCNTRQLYHYHMYLMGKEGIFFLPGKLGAVSASHTDADIRHLKSATEKFVAEVATR